jgi:hypothetical protein
MGKKYVKEKEAIKDFEKIIELLTEIVEEHKGEKSK